MKIALCYSGQIGAFNKVLETQKKSFIRKDWDVFIYTSQLVSQKVNKSPNHTPMSKVYKYLPAHTGWRKNQDISDIIYSIAQQDILNCFTSISSQIKDSFIENESLEESLTDHNLTKWEWLKKRQLRKMYNCNQLRKKYEEKNNFNYDIVVRSRFDIQTIPVDVEKIYSSSENSENKIFLFGGWPCTPPMVFMDEFICDGFAFGSPATMDKFCSLFLKEDAYPCNKKYKQTWEKFGDSVEYQIRTHLESSGVEIEYIGNKRSMYHIWR